MTPEPVFEDPWHAQLFAITVHLNETGLFTWPDWAIRFSATLKKHGVSRDLNGGKDYFDAWLETLENLLSDLGLADAADIRSLKQDWEQAYLSTPHGQPVRLAR